MYKQGVILELRQKEAVVFNDAGEYEKIERIEGMFVGQVVDYNKVHDKSINKFISAISVAAVLVAILFSYSLIKSFRYEVFAYVTLDINPSMEFSIDNKNCVLGLKPLNQEAEKITNGLSVKGKDIGLALSDVMDELGRLGYIDPESENIIVLSTSSGELWDADDKRNIQINETVTSLKEIVRDCTKNQAYIETISATPELRSLSVKSDMSLGRYALYTKALEEGKEISLQYAKTAPLSQLINNQAYISDSPDESSAGKSNTDELSKSDTTGSNKNTEEHKKDLTKPQSTETETLVSNAEIDRKNTLPDDEEDIKKVLPDTTMPKYEEARQLTEASPTLPTFNNGIPSPTPHVNVLEHNEQEPERSPDRNVYIEKSDTPIATPSLPPMFLPDKTDNGSEGGKPDHNFGILGEDDGGGRPFGEGGGRPFGEGGGRPFGEGGGRPFTDGDFSERGGFEGGVEDKEIQYSEPDSNIIPDKIESKPESSTEFTPGHGRKIRQRQQGVDETP